VKEAVVGLLEGCRRRAEGGEIINSDFETPPGQGPAWVPQLGVDFFSTRYPQNAAFLAFNESVSRGWDAKFLQFRKILWCTVNVLSTKHSKTDVPFSALFFRDERGGGGGGGGEAPSSSRKRKHAGLSTRLLYSQRDFPMPPAPRAALDFALDAALEILGEDVVSVWASSLKAALNDREKELEKLQGGGPPIFTTPYADAPLRDLKSAEPLGHLAHFLTQGRRLRICARRAALSGGKDTGVGGLTEANLVREMAAEITARVKAPSGEGINPVPPYLTSGGPGSETYLAPPRDRVRYPKDVKDFDIPYGSGHPERVPILFLDRGKDNGETVVGPYGRKFFNREGMMGVMAKYNLSVTVVEDVDLFPLSFEQQVAMFNSHKIFIGAHGAGMINTLFMPPRSAVVEVTPRGMWCPLFFRQNVYSGHFVFPVHSLKYSPSQHFIYSLGGHPDQPKTELYNSTQRYYRDVCELRGHFWSAQTSGSCFHEAKTVPVNTPLAEFEVALLHALDAVGAPTQHVGSPIHLLEGIPGKADYERGEGPEGVPLLAHTDKNYYDKRSWKLSPPSL